MNNYKADVIIVGAGISGMVAAYELINLGKKVIVLDKCLPNEFGAMAKISFGGMFFVNTSEQRLTGIKDNADIALQDWYSVAHFSEHDYWGKLWAQKYVYNCTDYVYRWIKKMGVTFFPIVQWVERGVYGPGSSFPRFHIAWGTGKGITDALENQICKHPNFKTHLSLCFEHNVTEIITENGAVIGVRGYNTQTHFEAKAENTILASGGMGGHLDKVLKHWPSDMIRPPKTLLNGLHPYIDGSMWDAAEDIGVNIINKNTFWNYSTGMHHPRPQFDKHGMAAFPPKSGVWLDASGKKIGPVPLIVHFDTKHSLQTILNTGYDYSWHVSNYKMMLKEFAISGAEFNIPFRDKNISLLLKSILKGNTDLIKDMIENCVDVITANTLDDLVAKMNRLQGDTLVSLDNLSKSVNDHDTMVNRGQKFYNDEQLRRVINARQYIGDKTRIYKPSPISNTDWGPYVALRLFPVSRKSLGGIQTNLNCQALDKNQNVISGLLAIGEAAGFGGGGLHGKGTLEGTFLGGCVLNGRIAAHTVSGKKLI